MKLLVGFFLFLVSLGCVAAPVQVDGVRIKELTDGSQLVLDLNAPAKFHSFILDNPPRLVVDLSNTRLKLSANALQLRTTDIKTIRAGVRAGINLRIVLDLADFIRGDAYLLESSDKQRQRLVLDVFRQQKPFPGTVGIHGSASGKNSGEPTRRALAWSGFRTHQDYVVVIDPGHGGKDPGAIGPRRTREKDVVLQISKHLRTLVNKEPGMRAVLTRHDDRYLRLYERIDIARRHQADLFVSVHADAFTNPQARGSSVYILSTKGASSAAARWLAENENEADLVGGVKLSVKDAELMPVVFDIYHDAILADSMTFADKVLGELGRVGHVHKDTVERAGFAVLKAPDIPSILVETAFISNHGEEAKLRTSHYQQKIAEAIMDGIRAYFVNRPPKQRVPEPYTLIAGSTEPLAPSLEQKLPSVFIPKPTKEVVLPEIELQPLKLVSKSSVPLRQEQSAPMTSSRANTQVHVIRRGESLADVADRYDVDVSALRSANNLSSRQLRMPVGTLLNIPGSGS